MKYKIGDLLEITTKDQSKHTGKYLPSTDSKVLVLKLDSGYNIGLNKSNIKSIKLIKKSEESKKVKLEYKPNPKLKTISILHTGGTIASQVSYETGGVIARYKPEELIAMFPELKNLANIKSRLISNMWSEDMNFNHYNLLAKEIQKEIKSGVDGIIVTHGTDMLAVTSAALSFILEDLDTPVILVGAQRSSDRGSSDAFSNLFAACKFITEIPFSEVAICMHENSSDETCLILPGTKTRKMHTSRRDAFKPINTLPIARIHKTKIEVLSPHRKPEGRKLKLKLFNPKLKIGILKSHPNMVAKEVSNYKGFDGLILEGTGMAGNFPVNKIDKYTSENYKIFNEIAKLAKKIPLIVTTQTIFGRINMNVYSTGRKLQEVGILGNHSDMLTETAFIKLAWLLSNYPKNKIKESVSHDFRGEITKRTLYKEDFLE